MLPVDKKANRQLRILVVGYYGHLNAGDDLLQQALTYIFQDHKLMFSSWQPSVACLNECDLVVVGGGSIWPGFSFFQNGDDFARFLKVPLMVLGISSRKTDAKALGKTKKLIQRAIIFHVRDEATFREFGMPVEIRKGVDLFWWAPFALKRKRNAKHGCTTVAVNLRGWAVDWEPKHVVSVIRRSGLRVLSLPMYFGSAKHDSNIELNDSDFMRAAGFEHVADRWSEEPLLNSDLCVAMRYHAILLSVRCRIPAIGFDYHPKLVAFFEENGVPELCVPLNDSQRLGEAINRVLSNYGEYTQKFGQIAADLEMVGAEDLAHFRLVFKSIEPRPRFGLLQRLLRKSLQYVS